MLIHELLLSGTPLGKLTEAPYFLRVTRHPTEPLVILNYDQIDSPKLNPVVRECRGLCLEEGSWDIVGRSFPRFFNYGEVPVDDKKFDWSNFTATQKEDGSLMLLYKYKNCWRVQTRGSFATGEVAPGVNKTWEQCFYEAGIDEIAMDSLSNMYTYVFEFASPYNKVVRRYETPTLFLLTAFQKNTGFELSDVLLDRYAEMLRVKRPPTYSFTSIHQIQDWLEVQPDATLEGMVLRDKNGLRLKVKNARYVMLHHLKDNGNIFHPKRLLGLYMKGEAEETLAYFPEIAPHLIDLAEKVEGAKSRMLMVWRCARSLLTQKSFAQCVTKMTPFSSILFTARKTGRDPIAIWSESEDLILKVLFKNGVQVRAA